MKKTITVFDIINSVNVANYPNNALFAIVTNNSIRTIGDYAKGNSFYKFDVVNGTIKETMIDVDIMHVNSELFKRALRAQWYYREMYSAIDIIAMIAGIDVDAMKAFAINNNIDVNAYIAKYQLLLLRLNELKRICIDTFGANDNASQTIKGIIDVFHDGQLTGYETEIKTIDESLSKINQTIDKDVNQLNIKEVKQSIDIFTKAFWLESEFDGIESYIYNANTRLTLQVMANCRRIANANGVMKWQDVSTDRIMKVIVMAMLERLYSMKHNIDNNANSKKA